MASSRLLMFCCGAIFVTGIVSFSSAARADSSAMDVGDVLAPQEQQPSNEQHNYAKRPPPGAPSEDGSMNVWDTSGPVEVSPHIPSNDSENNGSNGAYGIPSGVIVDGRPYMPNGQVPRPLPYNRGEGVVRGNPR